MPSSLALSGVDAHRAGHRRPARQREPQAALQVALGERVRRVGGDRPRQVGQRPGERRVDLQARLRRGRRAPGSAKKNFHSKAHCRRQAAEAVEVRPARPVGSSG